MIELAINFLSHDGHAWVFGQKENRTEKSRVLIIIMGVKNRSPVYRRGRAIRDVSYELGGTRAWVGYEMSGLFFFSLGVL